MEWEEWRSAITSELSSLKANETFEFSPEKTLRTPKTHISMCMIYQKKPNEKGEIEHYKPRLVGHGFRQRSGIDFDKISALFICITAVRLTLAVLRSHMTMRYLDVMTAFLETRVNKELYMNLFKAVVLLEERLRISSRTQVQVRARLSSSLYSLKQVDLNCFEILENVFTSIGFQRLKAEPEIYVLRGADKQMRKTVQA